MSGASAGGGFGATAAAPSAPAVANPLRVYRPDDSTDLAVFAASNRAAVEAALFEEGAVLFRNFAVDRPRAFVRAAVALVGEVEPGYTELPADPTGEPCYRSTPYSEKLSILFHNESAHRTSWPERQLFCCVRPSPEGGATPLADGQRILASLEPAIVETLRRRGLLYLRNFSADFDVDWPVYYRSHVRSEVEALCRADGSDFEWTPGGLRTWQQRPAFTRHPQSGVEFPFHQIFLHHPACLPADVRRALEGERAEDEMPRNVFYGDGEPIDDEVVVALQTAYDGARVRFAWEPGDVLMFDNLRMAHAREPFAGPREVLVALGRFARDGAGDDAAPSAGS